MRFCKSQTLEKLLLKEYCLFTNEKKRVEGGIESKKNAAK